MVDAKLLSLAMDLRARAQDILARAETMYDTDAQQTMREVAARHERLAQRVEQGAGAAECRRRLASDPAPPAHCAIAVPASSSATASRTAQARPSRPALGPGRAESVRLSQRHVRAPALFLPATSEEHRKAGQERYEIGRKPGRTDSDLDDAIENELDALRRPFDTAPSTPEGHGSAVSALSNDVAWRRHNRNR